MSIGENIKKLRKEKGFTQEVLASKANISRSYLADVENDRYNASVDVLRSIAKSLDASLTDLLKDKEDESSSTNTVLDLTKDVTDVEEAMKVILSQPGLLLNGNLLSDEDKIKVANAILMGLRFAAEQIEKEKGNK